MAAAHEKTTPLTIHEEADSDYYYEDQEPGSSCGCGCFRFPWRRQNGEEAWLGTKLKKAKEFSEVVAGPKWKNFIRKVGSYFTGNKKQRQNQRFQYDPQSYALNFDSGDADREDDGLLLSYSSRFSAPVAHQ